MAFSDEHSITVGFLGALFPLSGVKQPPWLKKKSLAYLNPTLIYLSSLKIPALYTTIPKTAVVMQARISYLCPPFYGNVPKN
jgi:hypothetical protein